MNGVRRTKQSLYPRCDGVLPHQANCLSQLRVEPFRLGRLVLHLARSCVATGLFASRSPGVNGLVFREHSIASIASAESSSQPPAFPFSGREDSLRVGVGANRDRSL